MSIVLIGGVASCALFFSTAKKYAADLKLKA